MYTFVTCENPSILFDYEDDQRDSPLAREVRRSGRVPLKVANGTHCSSSNSRRSSIKLVKVGCGVGIYSHLLFFINAISLSLIFKKKFDELYCDSN